jgi:hypothetical protein
MSACPAIKIEFAENCTTTLSRVFLVSRRRRYITIALAYICIILRVQCKQKIEN